MLIITIISSRASETTKREHRISKKKKKKKMRQDELSTQRTTFQFPENIFNLIQFKCYLLQIHNDSPK